MKDVYFGNEPPEKTKISMNGLMQCLKGFDQGLRNEHCAFRFGNWKITVGGYEESWRLSYKGEEVVIAFRTPDDYKAECLDNLNLATEDFLKVYFTVASTYGSDEKLRLITVLEHPEIAEMLDLSQALTEADQRKWEHGICMTIKDDRVVQKIAKKLARKGIDLYRYEMDPRAFCLGVNVSDTGRKVWFTLTVDGSLENLEREILNAYLNFTTPKASEQNLDTDLYMHKDVLSKKLKEAYNIAHKLIQEHLKGKRAEVSR